jgi:hypothetical protein
MQEPIIILGIPRSGTSLISGLFCLHGVFFGHCREADTHNPKGYFENKKISALKRRKPYNHIFYRREIYKILVSDGYAGEMWGVKFLPESIHMWNNFNPTFICCRRNLEPNYKSYSKFFTKTSNKFQAYYHKMHLAMDKISIFDIHTSKVVAGNFSELKKAIEYVGLEFNPELTNDFINKDYWHFD